GPAGDGRLQLPGIELTRSFDWVRLVRPRGGEVAACDYRLPAAVPGTVRIPGAGIAISLELIEKGETVGPPDCVYNIEADGLDWRSLSGPLELRNWRPGDRYQPRGCSGEEKLKI